MRLYTIPIIAAAVIAASGCAAQVWRDGYGREATKQDVALCEYDAERATIGMTSGIQQGFARADMMAHCLALKGYYREAK